jgi:hypothetical protein
VCLKVEDIVNALHMLLNHHSTVYGFQSQGTQGEFEKAIMDLLKKCLCCGRMNCGESKHGSDGS